MLYSGSMSDQDAFEGILASLHDAMLDETLWPATSALIDEACGLHGNALLVGQGPKEAVRVLCPGFYLRGQRHADWEREYLDIYYPIDERVPRVRQLPDSHLVHVTALYTTEELKTSLTYNELLRKSGAQDSLNVRLDGPDGSHYAWSTADPVAPGGWEAPQIAMIRALLPHIRQYVRVRWALAGAGALRTSVIRLLDNRRIGIIHLDRHGRIVAANDRARNILRQGDGLSDQDGILRARAPADQARLERLVAAALPSASAISGSMLLRRSSLLPRLVVHVKPVGSQQPDSGAQRTAVLVLIVEPGRQPHIDPALVATTLGLTPEETQVAVWLAEGRTVREIAVVTGRKESSIRWYLRKIYRRLGISRQADLVRLVLSVAEFA